MSGVPPSPLSITIAGPDASKSWTIGSTSIAAISFALASGTRCRPGSPWMPTPTSISSSGRSNVGLPAAGTVQLVRATPIERPVRVDPLGERHDGIEVVALFGGGAHDLLQEHGRSDSASAGRPGGVLDGDVVVDDDGCHADALGFGELGRHLEVEHVAGVVLHDVQHARARVDDLGRLEHLVGGGGGEDLTGARRIQHPGSDEAAVQRLVSGAAAGDQRDLAGPGRLAAVDDAVDGVDLQFRVRGRDARERVGENAAAGSLMNFFMSISPSRSGCRSFGGLGCSFRGARAVGSGVGDDAEEQAADDAAEQLGDEIDRQLLPGDGAAGELLHEHRSDRACRVDRGAGDRRDRDDRGEDDEADRRDPPSRAPPCGR